MKAVKKSKFEILINVLYQIVKIMELENLHLWQRLNFFQTHC